MRVNVQVHGLHFVVPCGEGAQTLKWLGLAVAQRYALAAPHGRCRTREDAHITQGFFLPAAITKAQSGQVLLPSKRISEVCKDNESLIVKLQQEVPVNEIGAPQLSPWAITAFSSLSKSSLSDVALLDQAGSKAPANNHESGHSGVASARHADAKEAAALIDEEMKEYARSEMLQQVNSGHFQSEMEVEAAFLYDWGRLSIDDLLDREHKDLVKTRDAMQELLLAHFSGINAAYMHYAVGMGERAYGMNGHEFAHFVQECELMHAIRDQAALAKIMTQCLRRDAFVSLYDRGTLSRVGFLHALLKVVFAGSGNNSGVTREVLDRQLTDKISPAINRLTTGPFRDHTHHDRVLAAFQDGRSKLLKLYARYARDNRDGDSKQESSSTWPMLLPAPALKALLYDCGMFCTGDPKAHDELFTRAMSQCFDGNGDLLEAQQSVVFAEFLEVLARVALHVLQESDLPPHDAIKVALDAVRSLPVAIPHARK